MQTIRPNTSQNQADTALIQTLLEAWPTWTADQRIEEFHKLKHPEVEELFLGLPTLDQAEIVAHVPSTERRYWLRILPPDDVVDLIQ
jgi:magnesium transporter